MSPKLRIVVVLVAIALAGCAKAPHPKTAASAIPGDHQIGFADTAASAKVAAANGTTADGTTAPRILLASAGAASADGDGADYVIGPLDVLDITVFQVPDLSGTFPVSATGQIDMPLVGAVSAGGKTLSQLKAELTKVLGDKYLQSPSVRVAMKDATSQRITIEGAVSKPGVYPTTGPTTLMQVVAMAGGLDRAVADQKGIVVFRKIDGKRQVAKFDYKAIRDGKLDDPVITGGDVVVVDESGMKASLRNLRDSLGMFGLFAPLLAL